jgi:hypothetical protein
MQSNISSVWSRSDAAGESLLRSLETLAGTQMLHYVDASLAFSMTRVVFLAHVMPRGALETQNDR